MPGLGRLCHTCHRGRGSRRCVFGRNAALNANVYGDTPVAMRTPRRPARGEEHELRFNRFSASTARPCRWITSSGFVVTFSIGDALAS